MPLASVDKYSVLDFATSPLLDSKRLRAFVVVAEELHFGRAAQRLHIAQPALSQQIRKLERELAVELFRRQPGRRVALTDSGRVLLNEGRRVLQVAERAATAAQRAARGEVGHLRVGFAPSIAASVLPTAVQLFRARVPAVSLELSELISDEIALGLRSDDLDVGLLRRPTNASDLALQLIYEEELRVVLPVGHELATLALIPVPRLSHEPLIISGRAKAPGWYNEIVSLYRRHGLSPHVIQEVATLPAQLGLVAAGLGVAIVPKSVEALGVPSVVVVPLDAPPVPLFGAYGAPASEMVELFLACARKAAAQWNNGAATAGD